MGLGLHELHLPANHAFLFNRGSTHIIWFGYEKKLFIQALRFHPLYRDFYRLLIATSIDHWLPRMLFVRLINQIGFHNSLAKQLLITAFYNLF